MASSLLGKAAPDFSDPIGLLEACHGRIEQHCSLLRRMCDHLDAHGADADIAAAASSVLRYFDIAAPLHHADEEQDLFPALGREAELHRLLTRLKAEHTQHAALWQALRPELLELVEGQVPGRLRERVEPFISANLGHLAIENEQVLPRARETLKSTELAQIGEAMAQRRRP
jgi:hemerythrin-like domain-containing protein